MSKTTLTLSDPTAKTLKIYTAQTKSSLHAQSKVVEEALREFFTKRGVKIKDYHVIEPKGGESADSTKQQSFGGYNDISFKE